MKKQPEKINLKLKGKWVSWIWRTPNGKISKIYSRNFMLKEKGKGGKK